MRKTILLFVVLHSISVTNAQASNDYRPFIEEGKVWVVGKFYGSSANGVPPHTTYTYFFDGDTIIDNKECKKWRCLSEGKYGGENKLVSYLFEEDRKVWYIMPQTKEPKLLYDFGVSKGDTTWVSSPEIGRSECVITEIMQTTRNSHELNCYCFADDIDINYLDDSYQSCNFWMEGIGSAYSPVLNAKLNVPGYNDILLECRIEEQILYSRKDNPMGFLNDQNAFQISRYRPFIEEGKRWEVDLFKSGGDASTNYVMVTQRELFFFDGDTVIADQTCKKMMCDTEIGGNHTITYEMGVYEEDKQVLYFAPGETEARLLYAFGEEPGTMVRVGQPRKDVRGDDLDENCLITSYQNITIDGFQVPCVCYVPEDEINNPQYWFKRTVWIVGVGSPKGPAFNCRNRIMARRAKCFVNDECLYDWSNFGTVAETSLIDMLNEMGAYEIPASWNPDAIQTHQIVNRKSVNNKWYDLSGRRVSHLQKGVYIKDGRKVVVK